MQIHADPDPQHCSVCFTKSVRFWKDISDNIFYFVMMDDSEMLAQNFTTQISVLIFCCKQNTYILLSPEIIFGTQLFIWRKKNLSANMMAINVILTLIVLRWEYSWKTSLLSLKNSTGSFLLLNISTLSTTGLYTFQIVKIKHLHFNNCGLRIILMQIRK